jgi:hypothetical protein
MISALCAGGSATIAETTAAAMSHHRGRIGTVPMSTLPDWATPVKLISRANGTRRIVRAEIATCDRALKRGRNATRLCNARAGHYDPKTEQNLCGLHARHTPTARLGRGKSWYETACASHSDRAAVAIGADDVARCFHCSYDYELTEAPLPVIDKNYFAKLASGAFA